MQIQIQVQGYLENVVPERFAREKTHLCLESPITLYSLIKDVMLIKNSEATVVVNGKLEGLQYIVRDGDDIKILSLIAGG